MQRHRPARRAQASLASDRRGAIAVWIALAVPLLLAASGIALSVGHGLVARQTAQIAADLGAQAGAIAYGANPNAQTAATVAANIAELNGVAAATRSWSAGSKTLTAGALTVAIGPGVTDATRTAVSLAVTRPVPTPFAAMLGNPSRSVTANGVAEAWTSSGAASDSGACVLAMHPSAASAIKVDNMGRIQTPGCDIFANSTAAGTATNAAIYLNSGTLSGKSISTPGKVCLSNSGSNTVSPTIPNNSCVSPAGTAKADPFAAMPLPSPTQTGCTQNATYGVCCKPPITGTVSGVSSAATNVVNQSYTAWQATPRTFNPANGGVFCGNTTIGGNGTTDQFAPGVYYVVNGNLTFNNSAITSANGVSFVLIGKNGGNPGAISWTNYSNTYTVAAPASGPTAGILFWQGCKADGTAPTNTMAGGSTLTMTGAFYAKCGALSLTNNIQMNAASGAAMRVVASTIYVAGSAGIQAALPAAATTTVNTALVR